MIDWLVKRFVPNPDDINHPQVRRRYGWLSGGVGIALNLLLAGGKCLAGVLSGSLAITADAFNNLSDAGSSIVTLVGFQMAAKEADQDHPFGHGRLEYLAGLGVAIAIILVGFEVGKSAFGKILTPEPVVFSWLTVGILLVSVAVKLWMAAFNRNLSRRIDSAAMAATAADSRSDALATGGVLLGLLVGHWLQLDIDGYVGILVAAFIIKAGWGAVKDTVDPLLGQSPDPELVEGIRTTVLDYPEITGIHDLVVHDYGPGRRMCSLHAEVSMEADMLEIHDVIDTVERELTKRFRIEAVIHMDPIATHDPKVIALRTQVAQLVGEIAPKMSIHDFRITAGPTHTNLIFDVVVPHDYHQNDETLRATIGEKLGRLEGNYYAVIAFDRSYV